MEGPSEPEPANDDESIVGVLDKADGGIKFVISDVTTDDRWIAVPQSASLALPEWR